MKKEELFESILKDSEKHTSKFMEDRFSSIAARSAVDEKAKEGVFEYSDMYDYDISEDGFVDVLYGIKDTKYAVTVNASFTDVDVGSDCDCDTPCDIGRPADSIRYESTGAWCTGVDIKADFTYSLFEDDDTVIEDTSADVIIDYLSGRGITVTAKDLEALNSDALARAEEEYEEMVNDDPGTYLCDCDCDCNCDRYDF